MYVCMFVCTNHKYHLKFDTSLKNVIKATVGKKLYLCMYSIFLNNVIK